MVAARKRDLRRNEPCLLTYLGSSEPYVEVTISIGHFSGESGVRHLRCDQTMTLDFNHRLWSLSLQRGRICFVWFIICLLSLTYPGSCRASVEVRMRYVSPR